MKKAGNKNNAGFTLMETLVSVLLVGVIGAITTTALFNLLTGSAKTESYKQIKQNGDYALTYMEQKIRSAVDVYNTGIGDCDDPSSSITVVYPPNQAIPAQIFSCETSGSNTRLKADDEYLTNSIVQVVACTNIFTCSLDASGYKTVKINFSLTADNATAPQLFQTQVKLRNKL